MNIILCYCDSHVSSQTSPFSLTPLFLQPPLRSSQPFSSSLSRKELYIRALIFFLTSFCNTFKSVQPPPPCGESFGQTAKVQPLLPLRHSSVNLGRAKRKKKYMTQKMLPSWVGEAGKAAGSE